MASCNVGSTIYDIKKQKDNYGHLWHHVKFWRTFSSDKHWRSQK